MLSTGQKTVTTSGVRVQLGTGIVNSPVLIKAPTTNSGIVYVGNSNVNSLVGFGLSAGQQVEIKEVGNLGNIYLDSSINNQTAYWIAFDEV